MEAASIQRDLIILVIAWTCVGVFVATALAAVLDMFQLTKLAPDIRKKLQVALILEIIALGAGSFSGFLKFDPALSQQVMEKLKPKVDLHIASENQQKKAVEIQAILQQQGFISRGIENVDGRAKIPENTEIRYFHDQDRETAESILDILKREGISSASPILVSGTEACLGRLEVWLSSKDGL